MASKKRESLGDTTQIFIPPPVNYFKENTSPKYHPSNNIMSNVYYVPPQLTQKDVQELLAWVKDKSTSITKY